MNKLGNATWEAVEADFRRGTLSTRQLAKRHGVSEAAIRKRSEAEGWVRTLAESAQGAHFDPKPRFAAVSAPGARETPLPKTGERLAQDHIELGSDIALRLLDELDATTSHVGELEQAIVDHTADDENGRRRDAMMKAVSLPVRAQTLKTIAQALGTLRGTEGDKGKKELKAEAAKAAATGRFAPPAPPRLLS